jgi:hypothetical protein
MSEQGLRPHLVHDIGAVDFDTDFADAGLVGNLLVHETVSDQTDQFAFARSQRFEARAQLLSLLFPFRA